MAKHEEQLDPVVVEAFAAKGIALQAVTKRKLAWSFSPYLKSGPATKDLRVNIHEVDYMGPVVHSVTVPNVHFDESHQVAEKVLAEYVASVEQNTSDWIGPPVSVAHLPGEEDPVSGGMYPDDIDAGPQ
jgi:hypothetical protein